VLSSARWFPLFRPSFVPNMAFLERSTSWSVGPPSLLTCLGHQSVVRCTDCRRPFKCLSPPKDVATALLLHRGNWIYGVFYPVYSILCCIMLRLETLLLIFFSQINDEHCPIFQCRFFLFCLYLSFHFSLPSRLRCRLAIACCPWA